MTEQVRNAVARLSHTAYIVEAEIVRLERIVPSLAENHRTVAVVIAERLRKQALAIRGQATALEAQL